MSDPITRPTIDDEKLALIGRLRTERQRHIAALRDLDLRAVVHAESGWRVQDLLSHLARWEREALATVQAFSAGEVYRQGEPLDRDAFNAQAYASARDHFPEQARIGWGMVRRDLQFAIHDVPADRFDEPLEFPWGGRGTLHALVAFVLDHEAAHVREILGARPADPATE